MKAIDLTNVQEAGEFKRPTPGAYVCSITAVTDVPDKEYLQIQYDIIEGEFKGYYSQMRKDHADWSGVGTYYKSYKPKALGMFKRFCSAVSKSNGKYVFDGNANADEKTLVGKKIGLVLQEEQYYGNDGNLKTRLIVNRECAVADVPTQKIPELKKAKEDTSADMAAIANNVPLAPEGEDAVPWS